MAEASTFYLEIITRSGSSTSAPPRPWSFPPWTARWECTPATSRRSLPWSRELRYKVDGKWEPAAVGAGFVEIKPDYVILLVGFAEHPEEIDRKRAEAARERAEERLRQKQSIHEYYHSKAALARAMARLKTRRE